MKPIGQTSVLRAVYESCEYLNPDAPGGAHADVMVIDPQRLGIGLRKLRGVTEVDPFGGALEELATKVSERFLLKRGKIEDFRMQLVGSKENVLPRDRISHAFGPYGYNLLPTVEKTLIDAHEAAREIPYLGYGDAEKLLAPDIIGQFCHAVNQRESPTGLPPTEAGLFLNLLDEIEGNDVELTLYDILDRDAYFKGRCRDFTELRAFQDFVRTNPLSRVMDDQLEAFFSAPITVGVRDTVRFAMGSRHPDLGWESARQTIMSSFERQRTENFLPAEITYYGIDFNQDLEKTRDLLALNDRVAEGFAALLDEQLRTRGFLGLEAVVMKRIARQVLDYHHGYALYDLEPYQGLLSVSTLKMAARVSTDLSLALAGIPLHQRRNTRLARLQTRPGDLRGLVARMDEAEQDTFFGALEAALAHYVRRGGVTDGTGNIWTYHPLPRTFYSFQERADFPSRARGTVEETFTLEELQQPPRNALLQTVPGLAEKLTVFFVLVHRYYKDTGFLPDLRPRNAGRDIFLLGIWGQISDNLLITVRRTDDGEVHTDLSFVDNKDQFKEYRRNEDRRAPVGIAKHAMRLTGSLVEPALLRSIGLFTELAYDNERGAERSRASLVEMYSTKGLDIVHEVIHSGIEQVFDNGKVVVEDVVDDLFTGLKKWFRPKR